VQRVGFPFAEIRVVSTGVSLCLEVSHHIEKVVGVLGLGVVSLLDIPLLVANKSMKGTIAALGPRGATGHGLPFVVLVVLQGDMWVFHLGEIGWILTPRLSKWRGTGLILRTMCVSRTGGWSLPCVMSD
jgi:hypothetical protein